LPALFTQLAVTPPEQNDFGGNFFEIAHLRDNWFYASSAN
jgi:hypothetical protein